MNRVLVFYSFLLSLIIAIGAGAITLQSGNPLFLIVFLPVVFYFVLKIIKKASGLKILLYYNFVLITIMAVMGFIGASSPPQLISAALFLPIAFYFWKMVLPKRNKKLPLPVKTQKKITKSEKEEVLKEVPQDVDKDRRKFLKLVGSAGFTLFLFSIFTQRTHAAFFGSVPGPGTVAIKDTAGVQIDPSQHHPTDGYKITEVDDSSPAFYGFVRKDGAWFIMKEDSAGAYRYFKGASSFSTNWTSRASLAYDYFDNIF